MASSSDIVFTVAFIFFLAFLPPKSVGVIFSSMKSESLQQKKMALGSRPPSCVNKCFNCRPCVATTLVIHPHKNMQENISREYYSSSHGGGGGGGRGDDGTYYLLLWKCKCGDKLFQP